MWFLFFLSDILWEILFTVLVPLILYILQMYLARREEIVHQPRRPPRRLVMREYNLRLRYKKQKQNQKKLPKHKLISSTVCVLCTRIVIDYLPFDQILVQTLCCELS